MIFTTITMAGIKRTLKFLPAVIFGFLGATTMSFAASGSAFECPWAPTQDLQLSASEIKALLPAGDPVDDPAKLNAAIDVMRAQGLSAVRIIDGLIGAYCPVVAGDASLSAAQKTSRVQKFAVRITRLVFSFEGADEIILDVPFSPPTVDAIRTKAAAAGLTPERWIAKAVDTGLIAQP